MNYPYAKFGDFSFNRFGLIRQTDRKSRRRGWSLYSRNYGRRELEVVLPCIFSFFMTILINTRVSTK